MKRFYLLALATVIVLVGCGDKICSIPEEDEVMLRVKLRCSKGLTMYSVEGSCYIEGEEKEYAVDAMNGRGWTFTVVPNTRYIVRANNVDRDGALFGSIEVVTPGPGQDTTVTIPCK